MRASLRSGDQVILLGRYVRSCHPVIVAVPGELFRIQILWLFEIQVNAEFFKSLLFDAGDAHEVFRFF